MKSIFIFLALFSAVPSIIAQTTMMVLEEEMNTLFQQKQYYNLLATQDQYFQRYPEVRKGTYKSWVLAQRMFAWLYLYDFENLRTELKAVDAVNPSFVDLLQFRHLVDEKYMAEFFAKTYITNPVLDPARDYRLKLTACDTVRGTLGPARSCYDVGFYDLSVAIDPEMRKIAGHNKIYFTATNPSEIIQIDLFEHYEIQSIRMDGISMDFSRNCNAIFIPLTSTLNPGQKSVLEIEYSGTPPEADNPPWNGGFVWKEDKGKYWDGVACEHLGASVWWPVKDHLSDKPDSMRITLRAPFGYQAISNGNLRSVAPNDDKTTSFEWFVSYPINSYNVTFYLGNFVNFNEQFEGKAGPYQIDYYVLKNHLKKAKKYYSQTKRIFEVFTDLFGDYPYPADGAGFVEAPFIGMEHQGAVAIGTVYNSDYQQIDIPDYDMLLVHETAHEWWGNTVAFGDMADAWISEGFSTYAEWMFIEKEFGYQKYLEAAGTYTRNIVNAWPIVGDRDVNDNNFITGDIYFKGAAMLHNLRCIMDNDSLFFRLIKGFYEEYRMKIASTNDFEAYVKNSCPGDLTAFLETFLYQGNPPVLEYSFTLSGGTLLLIYRWTGVPEDFTMPFCIVVHNNQCIRLTGTSAVQQYTFKGTDSFYIPTPFNFDPEILEPNSFTYFQTHYIRK